MTISERPAKASKLLPPYWAELGYELDPRTGLFHRRYEKLDGSGAHEVVLDAETFHSHRRINLARCLFAKANNAPSPILKESHDG